MRAFNNFLSLLRIVGFLFDRDWFDQPAPKNIEQLPEVTLLVLLHDCRHHTTAETSIQSELNHRCWKLHKAESEMFGQLEASSSTTLTEPYPLSD